ncbi:hypothetical protein GGTG_09809 [Gaeumannomyces tritici R3-111a-1]|uniref:Uncharacterized protein n=1 Tax=Gaeumannomyces tritici (strain R3-111a-1) TaxID=644352 RepID=J3P8H5_GAET3|nr:hypothetical protein GGTG_09809 [Gaeumannomyces tritici R3-111a-1]EJT72958.1 hypothetical protein GGTG_09809 [Gaeumannomyces tritici R3-111a-1]
MRAKDIITLLLALTSTVGALEQASLTVTSTKAASLTVTPDNTTSRLPNTLSTGTKAPVKPTGVPGKVEYKPPTTAAECRNGVCLNCCWIWSWVTFGFSCRYSRRHHTLSVAAAGRAQGLHGRRLAEQRADGEVGGKRGGGGKGGRRGYA